MFGTFQKELDDDKPVYGITENIKTYNLFKIASHEFAAIFKDVKRASKFSDKLKYMLKPPGWSHDGDLKTSDHLRKLEREGKL